MTFGYMLQLNRYETDPNSLKFFQSSTKVYLIIHVFCKSCEPKIVFVLICTLAVQFYAHKPCKMCESTLLCIANLEENTYLSHIHLAVRNSNFKTDQAFIHFVVSLISFLVGNE